MKNRILIIGAGLALFGAVQLAEAKLPEHEIFVIDQSESVAEMDAVLVNYMHVGERIAYFESFENAGWEVPSWELLSKALAVKVPIYSVPLPEENKIVLVKDPKGFVERAIRHKMEYLAIKPSDKGEFWELMPVFADEASSLSFSLNKSEDQASEEPEDEEPLRIVPVKDFIRYN